MERKHLPNGPFLRSVDPSSGSGRMIVGKQCIAGATATMQTHLTPPSLPPPPCKSYAEVPNKYGPYAYGSLDKAMDTQVQKEKIAL